MQKFTSGRIEALRRGKMNDPKTPGLSIEVSPGGKRIWRYQRRVSGLDTVIRLSFGAFPAKSISEARAWARQLNIRVENGLDPRGERRKETRHRRMTVAAAHALYMKAAEEGRASRARRANKPRTLSDKQEIYQRDIAPVLGHRLIFGVTERDLIKLVEEKGKAARVRANRLAAELRVFFGWASGIRGQEIGLKGDPSLRLAELRFPESPRQRALNLDEIEWFLRALSKEREYVRRGMLLWLLTAARFSELVLARTEEVKDGVWTIPASRSKNSTAHSIALGPWGRSLVASDSEWIFPADNASGPRAHSWHKALDRVRTRMEAIAGQSIPHFTLHDLRRTLRSNTKRLKIDFETAEAMMNHLKSGLARIYDTYELDVEKAKAFLIWEREVIRIARKAGAAKELAVPADSWRVPSGQLSNLEMLQVRVGGPAVSVRYSLTPLGARNGSREELPA